MALGKDFSEKDFNIDFDIDTIDDNPNIDDSLLYVKVTGVTEPGASYLINNEIDKAIWFIPSGAAMLKKREELIKQLLD